MRHHSVNNRLGHIFLVHGQWGFGFTGNGGHLGAHLTRPNHQHIHADIAQGLAQVHIETIHAGLGGTIHKIRPANPLASHRTQRNNIAVALSPELLRQQHTHRHRAGEVGLRRLHGQLLVVPQGLLVAQGAESHDSDVDVATGKRLVNDLRVVGEIGGVEINDLYLGGAGGLHQGDRAVKPG